MLMHATAGIARVHPFARIESVLLLVTPPGDVPVTAK